jgi:hypothetical protein
MDGFGADIAVLFVSYQERPLWMWMRPQVD